MAYTRCALAIEHLQLGARQVDMLDAQTQQFHEPEPGTVSQFRHQARGSGELIAKATDLLTTQHGWQFRAAIGAPEGNVTHVAVQCFPQDEDDRVQCLALRAPTGPLGDCEVTQECTDLTFVGGGD